MTPFDRFWNAYPRRDGKGAAIKAWDKIIKEMTPDELEEFTKMVVLALAEQKRLKWDATERQYTPMPSTWLNQQRWLDEIPSQVEKKSQGEIGTETRCGCGNVASIIYTKEPLCCRCATKTNHPTFNEEIKSGLRKLGFTKNPGESWKDASLRCLKDNDLSSMIPKAAE